MPNVIIQSHDGVEFPEMSVKEGEAVSIRHESRTSLYLHWWEKNEEDPDGVIVLTLPPGYRPAKE